MKPDSTLLLPLTILASSFAMASPIEDLTSPNQAVRDKAAAELRITFKSTPKSKWTPLIAKIANFQSEDEVTETLRTMNATLEATSGYGEGVVSANASGHPYRIKETGYRLDGSWILRCRFVNDKLAEHKLVLAPKAVALDPPKDFTGRWVTYRIDGQKCTEEDYIRGRRHGDRIVYYYDGSKLEEHYQDDMPDGEELYYYPSGKIAQKSRHKMGEAVGTWTWYDETGKITSTKEHSTP